MLTVSHRPGAIAIREGVSPFGQPEIVVFGVDQEAGIVVELCLDPEAAQTLGGQLAASKLVVASPADLEELRRHAHGNGGG